MKKVLLTSTALMLSAGVAAADVTVSGNGRMGIVYYEDVTAAGNAQQLAFSSRLRIVFTATGETDGGVAFGGSVRADNAIGGASGLAGTVYASYNGMKLSMGDTDSAAENAIGDVSGVGYSGITNNGLADPTNNGIPGIGGDTNETTYLTGGDVEVALFEYSFGDFAVYASAGQPQSANDEYSLGFKWAANGYSAGIGYEDKDNIGSQWLIGGSAAFGAATVKANYGNADMDVAGADFEQYAISLDYVFGATTVTGFYRGIDNQTAADVDFIGLGAAYDLGGGAALKGGLVNVDVNGGPSQLRADFGMTMTF